MQIDPAVENAHLGARAGAVLAEQQAVVDRLVRRGIAEGRWEARLRAADRDRLVARGHFPQYAAELDWTVGEIAGHLRDSARIFTERIHRLQVESRPLLPDFDTTAPERIADYRSTVPEAMLDQLRQAQDRLLRAVRGVEDDRLDRTGVHETDGTVTLADILGFLPGHQRDHAEQLWALVAPAEA